MPTSLTTIGAYALQNCSGIEKVVVPESVTSLGAGVFQGCSKLANVNIPSKITNLSDYLFDGCAISKITIPDKVTQVGNYAFRGCTKLDGITKFPATVTRVGSGVFQNCSSLSAFTMPDTVTALPTYMFSGCKNLSSVKMNEKTKSIGNNAFTNCTSLKSIAIPSTVTTMGSYVFSGCENLNNVKVPQGVTVINQYAFNNCSSLSNIDVPDTVTTIGDYAFSNTNLASFVMSNNVIKVGKNAFANSVNLQKVTISTNEKMLVLDVGVFSGCKSLNNVVIPVNITTLNLGAFKDCKSLTNLTVKGNGVTHIDNPFLDTSSDLVVRLCSTSQLISYCDMVGIKYVVADDDRPNIVSIKTDKVSPQTEGNKIKITTDAIGEGKLSYLYMIMKDGVVNYTSVKYSDDNSLEWTPNVAGNYTINCIVSDKDGNITIKSINYVVKKNPAVTPLQIISLKTNFQSPQKAGQPIKLMTTAKGQGTLKYKFVVFKNGTKQVFTKKYRTQRYAFWTPTEKGSYLIVAKVTDSTGKEVRTSIKFTVQ